MPSSICCNIAVGQLFGTFIALFLFSLFWGILYNSGLVSLQCISDQHRAKLINSSRDLPDNILNFARRHALMSRQIQPVGGRPVLLQRSADYTKIAVKQVVGLDGRVYDMLFIGTGQFLSYLFDFEMKKSLRFMFDCDMKIITIWGW